MTFGWNAAGQNTQIGQSGGSMTNFSRDPVGRIDARGSAATFLYCGFDSSPCGEVDSSGLVQAFASLPGGVLLSLQAGGTQIWSYPNIEGDMIATANSSGTLTGGPITYDPFGAEDPAQVPVDNVNSNVDFGAYGASQILEEHGRETGGTPVLEMGARPYIPSVGRFMAVDPIQGGCANAYEYAYGDPENQQDTNGQNYCFNISAQMAVGLGRKLVDGGDLAETLSALLPGPIAELVGEALGAAAAAFGEELVREGEGAISAASNGELARVHIYIPTITIFGLNTGIPDGIRAIVYVDIPITKEDGGGNSSPPPCPV